MFEGGGGLVLEVLFTENCTLLSKQKKVDNLYRMTNIVQPDARLSDERRGSQASV